MSNTIIVRKARITISCDRLDICKHNSGSVCIGCKYNLTEPPIKTDKFKRKPVGGEKKRNRTINYREFK